jgi:DNA-binding NarL/FixJ family response regulator
LVKGEAIGIQKGRKITIQVIKLYREGKSVSEIASKLGITEAEISEILEEL